VAGIGEVVCGGAEVEDFPEILEKGGQSVSGAWLLFHSINSKNMGIKK
jgi:hypothetical protein